jgi:hypothetical protein
MEVIAKMGTEATMAFILSFFWQNRFKMVKNKLFLGGFSSCQISNFFMKIIKSYIKLK